MSVETGPHRSGVYITQREVYDKVQDLENEVIKFKVWFAVIGFIVAPIVSTIAATTAMSLMGGN